jgi:hypothetical protein
MASKKRKEENKNLKWASIPFLIIVALIVFLTLEIDNKRSKEMVWNNRQLPYCEISGIVSSARQNRGTISLRLKNNDIFYISTTRNYNLKPYDLDDFLQPGDSLYKKKNSMKLEVYRNNQKYEFILEKKIGKK